jgi:hypothetical protein
MSFRDHVSNIMDNLIASGIYSAAILVVIKFWRIVIMFTALANQPPIERRPIPSTFVNNSLWMQWEAAQRQQDLAALFATR